MSLLSALSAPVTSAFHYFWPFQQRRSAAEESDGVDRYSTLPTAVYVLILSYLPHTALFTISRLSHATSHLSTHIECDALYRRLIIEAADVHRPHNTNWRTLVTHLLQQRLFIPAISGRHQVDDTVTQSASTTLPNNIV